MKNFLIPDRLSSIGAQTKRMKRLIAPFALLGCDGRGQINELPADDGRGPALSGNGFSPGHVLRRAPLDRIMAGGSDALAGRSAKLRPVTRAGQSGRYQKNNCQWRFK